MTQSDRAAVSPLAQVVVNPSGLEGGSQLDQGVVSPLGQVVVSPLGQGVVSPLGQVVVSPLGQVGAKH